MKWKNLFVILAFLAVLLPSPVPASQPTEEWVSVYDRGYKESPSALAVDSSGNVYVTGWAQNSEGTNDFATVKYDANGNELWVKKYNGGFGLDIAVDSSGNVYVQGTSGISGTQDLITIKYATNGNELWVRRHAGFRSDVSTANGLRSNTIAVDSSGNVYVTGESNGDYATIKLDTNGNELWTRTYDSGSGDVASALAVDSSGSVYVTGQSTGGYSTIKYDTNGNELWVAINGGGDSAPDLAVDSSGNVYVTGRSHGGSSFDYETVKYDANGNELWVRRYDGGSSDWPWGLAIDSSGNVFVTGSSRNPSDGTNHYATVKYDTDGNELWVDVFDGGTWDDAYALAVDSSGNVYVTGESFNSDWTAAFVTIKYEPSGNVLWTVRYELVWDAWPVDFEVDSSNNIYILGWTALSSGGNDYTTIKYSQGLTTPAEVIPIVEEMLATGEITSNGVANAIITKLNEAQAFLDAGDTASARTKLEETIDLIEAQRGNHITPAAADELIGYINNIIAGL
jgi:uncharacterized delta-60 repeat protein